MKRYLIIIFIIGFIGCWNEEKSTTTTTIKVEKSVITKEELKTENKIDIKETVSAIDKKTENSKEVKKKETKKVSIKEPINWNKKESKYWNKKEKKEFRKDYLVIEDKEKILPNHLPNNIQKDEISGEYYYKLEGQNLKEVKKKETKKKPLTKKEEREIYNNLLKLSLSSTPCKVMEKWVTNSKDIANFAKNVNKCAQNIDSTKATNSLAKIDQLNIDSTKAINKINEINSILLKLNEINLDSTKAINKIESLKTKDATK